MKRVLLTLYCLLMVTPAWGEETPQRPSIKEFVTRMKAESGRHNGKEVIRIYEDFSTANPDLYLPFTVRVLYAQALANTGQIDKAIETLQVIVSEVPVELDYLRLQYDLANLLVLQGRRREAQKAYEQLLLRASEQLQLAERARERVAKIKGREAKKGDEVSLQLLDIETALEAGQVPEGGKEFLKGIGQRMPETPHAETAHRLLDKIHDLEDEKAFALLNEARRLFDQERKYAEVKVLLDSILKDYPDCSDIRSVEVLKKEVEKHLGR